MKISSRSVVISNLSLSTVWETNEVGTCETWIISEQIYLGGDTGSPSTATCRFDNRREPAYNRSGLLEYHPFPRIANAIYPKEFTSCGRSNPTGDENDANHRTKPAEQK